MNHVIVLVQHCHNDEIQYNPFACHLHQCGFIAIIPSLVSHLWALAYLLPDFYCHDHLIFLRDLNLYHLQMLNTLVFSVLLFKYCFTLPFMHIIEKLKLCNVCRTSGLFMILLSCMWPSPKLSSFWVTQSCFWSLRETSTGGQKCRFIVCVTKLNLGGHIMFTCQIIILQNRCNLEVAHVHSGKVLSCVGQRRSTQEVF